MQKEIKNLLQHPAYVAEASNKSALAAGLGHPLFVSANEKEEKETNREED